jgi:GntR family transcriptional regulator
MMTQLDRSSPLPLHYQLKQILLEKIEQGEWKPGDLIPGEAELQTTYGLSRITVRQALTDLVYEGRLTRQRGRGTFVAPPKFEHNPARHRGINYYLTQQGLTPGWRVLETGWARPSAQVRRQLALPPEARAYCIRRLRLANDQPVGYLVAWLPEAIAEQINHEALTEGESLRYLRHLPQMHRSSAERSLEAVAAGAVEAKLLGLPKNAPLMRIERLVRAADGAPLEYLVALYRGDRLKYQFTTTDQNGTPS